MGSRTLKKKIELNYRRGYTSRSCGNCNHFVGEFAVFGIGNTNLNRVEPRCKIMGFEAGRAYRIYPNKICDRFDKKNK